MSLWRPTSKWHPLEHLPRFTYQHTAQTGGRGCGSLAIQYDPLILALASCYQAEWYGAMIIFRGNPFSEHEQAPPT